MVQEAIMFLCGHIGKKMTDLVIDRTGEPVTLLCACFRVIGAFVQSRARQYYKASHIENMPEHKFKVEFDIPDDHSEPEDYTAVNQRIQAMRLTPKQSKVLEYRMNGLGPTEIGRIIYENSKPRLAASRVYETLKFIRMKYHESFNNLLYQTDISKLNLTPTQRKVAERYLQGERLFEIARDCSVTRQAAFAAIKKVRDKIPDANRIKLPNLTES